jgi:hypothetical protein
VKGWTSTAIKSFAWHSIAKHKLREDSTLHCTCILCKTRNEKSTACEQTWGNSERLGRDGIDTGFESQDFDYWIAEAT